MPSVVENLVVITIDFIERLSYQFKCSLLRITLSWRDMNGMSEISCI